MLRAATETAIIGTDADGVITFFSAGAERMFGYGSSEVVGRSSLVDFLDPADVATRAAEVGVPAGMAVLGSGTIERAGDASIWTYHRKGAARGGRP